jgi:hypothetical protein
MLSIFKPPPYKVRFLGVNQVEYREGSKKLVLEGERLAPDTGISLWYWFTKNHEWLQPAGTAVSDDEKENIKENIVNYFSKKGVVVEIEIVKA